MSALINNANIFTNKPLSLTYAAVRYKKNFGGGAKKWPDPYSYKYDRWGRVKKLEPPGGAKHIPFDKRYPINPKDVAPTKLGGKIELCRTIGLDKCLFFSLYALVVVLFVPLFVMCDFGANYTSQSSSVSESASTSEYSADRKVPIGFCGSSYIYQSTSVIFFIFIRIRILQNCTLSTPEFGKVSDI